MRVRFVQITCIICARIEEYRRIQTGNPAQFPLFGLQMIRHQSGNVRAHTVPNKVHIIGQHATRMPRQILDQLCNAQAAEARRPLHLAETWFLHQAAVVDDDDVVVAAPEVRLAYVRTGIVVATAAKPVYHDLGGMRPIEVRPIQRFGVQHVQQLRLLLGATRVQVELDAGVRTAVRLLDARLRGERIVGDAGGGFLGGLAVCTSAQQMRRKKYTNVTIVNLPVKRCSIICILNLVERLIKYTLEGHLHFANDMCTTQDTIQDNLTNHYTIPKPDVRLIILIKTLVSILVNWIDFYKQY